MTWIIYDGALFVGPDSRAIQTEAQLRSVVHLVICSTSPDLDRLPHLWSANLYLAEKQGNSNKKEFLQKLQVQTLTCQRTKLESINMHILKMNLPYRVLFLEVNQAARLEVENDLQCKKHFTCTNLTLILKS